MASPLYSPSLSLRSLEAAPDPLYPEPTDAPTPHPLGEIPPTIRGPTPPLSPAWQPLTHGAITAEPSMPRILPSLPQGSPLLANPVEAFYHRHLRHDTERQRAVLSRMAEAHTSGGTELETCLLYTSPSPRDS